jgi:chromosomal replication initiation ATPase DnaA
MIRAGMSAGGQGALPLEPVRAPGGILVGACNRQAVGALFGADWSGARYLEGPPASGKTLFASAWAAQTGAAILAASALDLEAAGRLADAGCAGVDGLEALGGPEREEALFHLANGLAREGGRLLLTARGPPRGLALSLPDLATRLNAVQVLRIEEPDDEFLERLLLHLAEARQLALPQAVAGFLVTRMARSHVAAINLIEALDRLSLEARRPVSRELGAEALRRAGF